MVTVFHARDVTEAQIICGLLQSHGIPATAGGYFLQGAVGELPPSDFATVNVPDEHVPAARTLIEQYSRGELAVDEDDSQHS